MNFIGMILDIKSTVEKSAFVLHCQGPSRVEGVFLYFDVIIIIENGTVFSRHYSQQVRPSLWKLLVYMWKGVSGDGCLI